MDEDFFASLPGGQAVIDWFGACPHFHDATLERFDLAAGRATLVLRAHRMTSDVDAQGYFVCDREALVEFQMLGVTGVKLEGDAGSIILELTIRRLTEAPDRSAWPTCVGPEVGNIEIEFSTSVGLYGKIYGKDLHVALQPLAETVTA